MNERRRGRWESDSEEDDGDSDKVGRKSKENGKTKDKMTNLKEKKRKTISSPKENKNEDIRGSSCGDIQSNELERSLVAGNSNNQLDLNKQQQQQQQQLQHRTIEKVRYNPLFEGCRSVEVYQRLNFIDQGTYGLVFRAKCTETNEIVAIKQVKLGMNESKTGFPITALREINILLSLKHPNIVNVKEMVVGSSIDKMYMVMEYLENDLKSCIQTSSSPFSIAEIKTLMSQLLSGVNHMHQHWYIHRDLKSSNLLYSNKGKLAICDFGMARKYGSPVQAYTFEVVTLWYRSPELLLGETIYSTAVDIWSIGCIFGELILRKPLFPGQGEPDQLLKIFKILGAPTEERWPGVNSLPNTNKLNISRLPARSKLREIFPGTAFGGGVQLSDRGFDLLNRLLCMDPRQRISSSEALNHDFFQEIPLPCSEDAMPKFPSRHPETEE